MATYVQIDEGALKETINAQLGNLEGIIRNKGKQALKTLLRKFKQRAIQSASAAVIQRLSPSICDDSDDIGKGLNQLNDFLQGTGNALNKLTQTANKILN